MPRLRVYWEFRKARQDRSTVKRNNYCKKCCHKTRSFMSDEMQTNRRSWQGRLDEIEEVDGVPFGEEAAWDKLYARLDTTSSSSRKNRWYWIAASIAMLVSAY